MIQRVVVLFPNSETITRQNGYLIGKVMINHFGFGAWPIVGKGNIRVCADVSVAAVRKWNGVHAVDACCLIMSNKNT